MSKFSELTAATIAHPGGRCKVPMIRAALDAEDAVDFDAALVSPMTAAQLSRILGLMVPDLRVSPEALRKHRDRVCSCAVLAAKGAL